MQPTATADARGCKEVLSTVDEVDVAARSIPLEVRRLQCTKALLALKEVTKNDATPQSSKLVDFIVLMTFDNDQMGSEKALCQWLVAQMCDRMETGQIWIMAKTYALLSALLWRGSNSFAEAVHEYGAAMFQASHTSSLLRSTPQENASGERLPCSLQPIVKSAAGQKSAAGKAKSGTPCIFDQMELKVSGPAGQTIPESIPDAELTFAVSNIAYVESLCEYRVRHPTLDLAHGEILVSDAASAQKTYSPTMWKEVVDDTLELMKAIAVTDPQAPICGLAVAAATCRVREAVLLYQVACRLLVRLLHCSINVSHAFAASIQAGLELPLTSNPTDSKAEATAANAVARSFSGMTFNLDNVDFSISIDVGRNLMKAYYTSIYHFNRAVHMLRSYCTEAQDCVDSTTLRRARTAFKTLPEGCILQMRQALDEYDDPIFLPALERLHAAARQAAEKKKNRKSSALSKTPADVHVDCSSQAALVNPSPLYEDESLRQSMLLVHRYSLIDKEREEKMWSEQVRALCGLFNERESQMLHQIFTTGLRGLWQQWEDFTNDGAAAAEQALTVSLGSSCSPTKSMSDVVDHPVPRTATGALGDRSTELEYTSTKTLTHTSTYILRSLPSGARVRAASGTKTNLITLDRSNTSESLTESSIDALLQEDDVVVICNEECSCNDTLKLVDRFQVLLDVPLGEGSYGKVYRAWDEVVGCYLAAKELPLDASKAHNVAVREVLQEYTVLTELSHPNIVRVVAFMVLKQTARIYMEWMPSGSLQDVLRHHPRKMLRENVVRRYARDVLSGLAFLHSRGVIHRDVKPGNMLLSSDGAVKLTDFGTSLVLSGNNHTMESDVVTGTAAYMAPESMQGMQSSASDIWSFGCSIVQLISGNVPWYNPTSGSPTESIALLFKIGSLNDTTHLERPHDALKAAASAASPVAGDTVPSLSTFPSVDPDLEDAVEEKDSSSAGDADDAASEELLSMLDAIFVVDRKKRPSASELLQFPFFKIVD